MLAEERGFRIRNREGVLRNAAPVEAQQGGGVANVEGAQHHQVEEAEHRHVDADSDGQHQDGGHREAGRLAQHAGGVANVLREAVDPGPAPGLARLFAQVECVAQIAAALARRHFAMEFQVVGQFTVEAAAVQQIAQAAEELHDGPQAVRRTA